MEKAKKKRIKKYIFWICAAALVAYLAAMPLLAKNGVSDDGPKASILSGQVQTGSVSTVLRGGGTLTQEEGVKVTIPAGVKLTEFLVSNGDVVTKGQPLASVDRVSVMGAITGVQKTLEHLSGEIQKASDEELSQRVNAGAGGRVKTVYAKPGDLVQDVMLEHGALAVLSLDGLMAVDIRTKTLVSVGDAVSVQFSDGSEMDGRVSSVLGQEAVITVEDNGFVPGETVKVLNTDGKQIDAGTLYVHSAWNAVAFSGTVGDVKVTEGQQVRSGNTLFTLTDTDSTGEFETLTNQRREYEALMLELFRLYQDTTLNAPENGVVSGVDRDSVHLLRAKGENARLTFLANAPNGDDENAYSNFVGIVTAMGSDGWEILLDTQPIPITDYKLLAGIVPNPENMTQTVTFIPQVSIYELVEDQWQQIGAEQIQAGDVLLFAGDDKGNFVWVVRLTKTAQSPERPGLPEIPDSSGQEFPPSFGGGFPGKIQEPEFELYELEGSTVMSVIPRNTMTLTISIDERDISKVTLGQIAQVRLEALKNQSFSASVTAIAGEGTNSGGSSKFAVELTLTREENMLDGMSATAEIVLATVENVLTVPVAALSERGSQTIVYTDYDEKSGTLGAPVVVQTGVSDGAYVQILSGLDLGDSFWYAYYDTLELSHTPESGGFSFG